METAGFTGFVFGSDRVSVTYTRQTERERSTETDRQTDRQTDVGLQCLITAAHRRLKE